MDFDFEFQIQLSDIWVELRSIKTKTKLEINRKLRNTLITVCWLRSEFRALLRFAIKRNLKSKSFIGDHYLRQRTVGSVNKSTQTSVNKELKISFRYRNETKFCQSFNELITRSIFITIIRINVWLISRDSNNVWINTWVNERQNIGSNEVYKRLKWLGEGFSLISLHIIATHLTTYSYKTIALYLIIARIEWKEKPKNLWIQSRFINKNRFL